MTVSDIVFGDMDNEVVLVAGIMDEPRIEQAGVHFRGNCLADVAFPFILYQRNMDGE